MEGPISIKEILTQLDGEFPMDEAVIGGDDDLLIITNCHETHTDFDRSFATGNYLSLGRELRY